MEGLLLSEWKLGRYFDCCNFLFGINDSFFNYNNSTIGATFCIVLTDAGNFPPPFRIDNFSEVPISYVQAGINDESLRLVVKPLHSKPFALVRYIAFNSIQKRK